MNPTAKPAPSASTGSTPARMPIAGAAASSISTGTPGDLSAAGTSRLSHPSRGRRPPPPGPGLRQPDQAPGKRAAVVHDRPLGHAERSRREGLHQQAFPHLARPPELVGIVAAAELDPVKPAGEGLLEAPAEQDGSRGEAAEVGIEAPLEHVSHPAILEGQVYGEGARPGAKEVEAEDPAAGRPAAQVGVEAPCLGAREDRRSALRLPARAFEPERLVELGVEAGRLRHDLEPEGAELLNAALVAAKLLAQAAAQPGPERLPVRRARELDDGRPLLHARQKPRARGSEAARQRASTFVVTGQQGKGEVARPKLHRRPRQLARGLTILRKRREERRVVVGEGIQPAPSARERENAGQAASGPALDQMELAAAEGAPEGDEPAGAQEGSGADGVGELVPLLGEGLDLVANP